MERKSQSRHASRYIARAGRRVRPAHFDGRERLLDVAVERFAERGIANTTVAQIAAAAKVTSAMVHYWFDTREKLLDAVVEERLSPIIRRLWEPAETEHTSALDLVVALLRRMLDVTDEIPWLASLFPREIVQQGGLLRERVLSRIPREPNALLRRQIIEAQTRGEFNPQIVPELLFFSMVGLVMLPQSAGSKGWHRLDADIGCYERAKLERHAAALLMHGLTGRGEGNGNSRSAK